MSKPSPAFPAISGRRHLRRTALLGAVLLLAVLPREARSQQAIHVEPGTRVRVTAPLVLPRPLAGQLVSLTADTVVLAPRDTIRIAVARHSIQRLDLTLGHDRANGALRGGFAGLLLGSAAELMIPQDDGGPDGPCFPCVGGGYTLLGIVLGGTLGAILAPERWQRIGR